LPPVSCANFHPNAVTTLARSLPSILPSARPSPLSPHFPAGRHFDVAPVRLKFPYTSCPQQALRPRRPTEFLRRLRGTKTLNSFTENVVAVAYCPLNSRESASNEIAPGSRPGTDSLCDAFGIDLPCECRPCVIVNPSQHTDGIAWLPATSVCNRR